MPDAFCGHTSAASCASLRLLRAGNGRGDQSGLTLIELVIAIAATTVIVGGIVAAIITVFYNQRTVYSRLSDSHDAQITSTYFVRDVQSSAWISGPSALPLCPTPSPPSGSADSQQLGIQWTGVGTARASVSFDSLSYTASNGNTVYELVRNFCSGSGATTSGVMAHGVSGSVPPAVSISCSSPSCPIATLIPSSSVSSVTLSITEQTGFSYSLAASPRLWSQAAGALPPGSPPLLLLGLALPS